MYTKSNIEYQFKAIYSSNACFFYMILLQFILIASFSFVFMFNVNAVTLTNNIPANPVHANAEDINSYLPKHDIDLDKYKQKHTPEEKYINLYSSRKGVFINNLLDVFTERTGIKVNLVVDTAGKIINRLKSEGATTEADVILFSDITSTIKAADAGVLAIYNSEYIKERGNKTLMDDLNRWFMISLRGRILFMNKNNQEGLAKVKGYFDLAKPEMHNSVLVRSSNNVYNRSLLSYIIASAGYDEAKNWAQGLVNNFARPPQGNDTAQLYALAAGEGEVVIANHYYYARLSQSTSQLGRDAFDQIVPVYPVDPHLTGVNINASTVAMVKYSIARKRYAKQFIDFLFSVEAQNMIVTESFEFPVASVTEYSRILMEIGDSLMSMFPARMFDKIASHEKDAIKIAEEVGWR